MSPVIAPVRARTAVRAWVSEHGAVAEQSVPLPPGDAYTVLIVAACDTAGAAATHPRAARMVIAARVVRPRPWPVRDRGMMRTPCGTGRIPTDGVVPGLR